MTPRAYTADEIVDLLDMPGCIGAIRRAMIELTESGIAQPLREIVEVAPHHLFGVMPGMLGTRSHYGAKLVAVAEDRDRPGRTAHQGLVALFGRDEAALLCTGDAKAITTLRTGAASAVATDALARPEAHTLGLFGCGELAASHIAAIACVRDITEVRVWGRDAARTTQFAAAHTRPDLPVTAVADPRAAAACDILCTVTSSATPILLGEWVRPGTHVNLVGSSYRGPVEVDAELVVSGRYVADSRRSALAAAAEFLDARDAGLVGDDHLVAEIGEVLLGRVAGRRGNDEVTIYKSLGHIVQDLAALAYVHAGVGDRPAA